MTSTINTCHGNPTVSLPLENVRSHNRLVLCKNASEQAVWESSLLLSTTDSLRIDAWHGHFVGRYQGACVLPAGDYDAMLEDTTKKRLNIGTLRITDQELFASDFNGEKNNFFKQNTDWHTNGKWKNESEGIIASNTGAYLFAEGNMHGRLEGRFTCHETPCERASWGLIARHYNAFNHLRVALSCCDQRLRVQLICNKGMPPNQEPPDVLGEAFIPFQLYEGQNICWTLNGTRHEILINGKKVLEACENYMGGVTVVGLFSETTALCWQDFSMTSTQPVQRQQIRRKSYSASIRPGNISQIRLLASEAPEQNICWESGVQFGHIGGSEIKFTQAAQLEVAFESDIFSEVRWSGPMPKFVDQSDDVRGRSRGMACFYPHRIVLADYVLPWVKRSVGPDIDLFAHIVNVPARIALKDSCDFQEWHLPQDGSMNFITSGDCSDIYPAAIAFPLLLGSQQWWLKVVITNLLHVDENETASLFAWRCPHNLVASHDFRVSPCQPGIEYGFSIVISWQKSDDVNVVQKDLLNLRDDWTRPMKPMPLVGSVPDYVEDKEQPPEAIGYDGCFNRATGMYSLISDQDRAMVQLDPEGIMRQFPTFCIDGIDRGQAMKYKINDQLLKKDIEYQEQHAQGNQRILILNRSLKSPAVLEAVIE